VKIKKLSAGLTTVQTAGIIVLSAILFYNFKFPNNRSFIGLYSYGEHISGKNINPDNSRPDVSDNLDHCESEEQDVKGEHTTHNTKEHKTPPKNQK
jgi:hypothetical protein